MTLEEMIDMFRFNLGIYAQEKDLDSADGRIKISTILGLSQLSFEDDEFLIHVYRIMMKNFGHLPATKFFETIGNVWEANEGKY